MRRWSVTIFAHQFMTAQEQLMKETRDLVKQWENCQLVTDPKDFPVIAESFGVVIIDGVCHEFKSHEEATQFRKENKVMSSLSSFQRNLKEKNVWIAKEVLRKKIEIAQKYVEEKVKSDVQFAQDVLEIAGDHLPSEIKKLAEETIAKDLQAKAAIEDQSLVSVSGLVAELVPVQTDGGGEILVHETELPNYPKDK